LRLSPSGKLRFPAALQLDRTPFWKSIRALIVTVRIPPAPVMRPNVAELM
jgi:hypothetical protein